MTSTEDCWYWAGNTSGGGWAMLTSGLMAYRVIYENMVGKIPEGLELDHLCENPICVNPEHLEPVTHQVNTLRHYRNRTHCRNGHAYSDGVYWVTKKANISKVNPTGLSRVCGTCRKYWSDERRKRTRERASLANQCRRGHEMTPENTYLLKSRNITYCRACMAINSKNYQPTSNRRRREANRANKATPTRDKGGDDE